MYEILLTLFFDWGQESTDHKRKKDEEGKTSASDSSHRRSIKGEEI